jgi:hypothetical protein
MLLKNHIIYSSVNVKMKCQVVLSFTAVEDGIFASTLRSLINGDARLFLSRKKSILYTNFHAMNLKLVGRVDFSSSSFIQASLVIRDLRVR